MLFHINIHTHAHAHLFLILCISVGEKFDVYIKKVFDKENVQWRWETNFEIYNIPH